MRVKSCSADPSPRHGGICTHWTVLGSASCKAKGIYLYHVVSYKHERTYVCGRKNGRISHENKERLKHGGRGWGVNVCSRHTIVVLASLIPIVDLPFHERKYVIPPRRALAGMEI